MKLCFVIPEYNQKTSSHFRYLYMFIEKLAQTHEVFVVAETGDDECKIKGIVGYKRNSKIHPVVRLIQRFIWFIELRFNGYNTFYCHYCELSTILLSFISAFTRARVFKWHCSQQHLYQSADLKSRINNLIVTSSLKMATKIVTCTPQMKQYFHKHYSRSSDHVVVLPNYLCLQDFKPKTKNLKTKKLYRLLFVHRLSPRKGAERLIPLAQEIVRQKLPFVIDVVGDGPLFPTIEKQIDDLQLKGTVKLHGKISNDKIGQFFKKADIFIMPSREEEFGRVQLEAMYYGVPIVATRTLSSEYVLNANQQKYVVEQDDYLQILDSTLDLLENMNQYQSLVKSGYAQLEQFSLKNSLSLFEERILSP